MPGRLLTLFRPYTMKIPRDKGPIFDTSPSINGFPTYPNHLPFLRYCSPQAASLRHFSCSPGQLSNTQPSLSFACLDENGISVSALFEFLTLSPPTPQTPVPSPSALFLPPPVHNPFLRLVLQALVRLFFFSTSRLLSRGHRALKPLFFSRL